MKERVERLEVEQTSYGSHCTTPAFVIHDDCVAFHYAFIMEVSATT